MAIASRTFDLDQYIQKYIGHTKVLRLLFIARNSEELKLQAWKMALDELKLGINTQLYKELCEEVDMKLGDAYLLDIDFIETTDRKSSQRLKRLENELSSYKANLMKDSIRIAHNEIGLFYLKRGDLSASFRCYVRSRDYCSTNNHIIEMCLNIIKISILMGNYLNVSSFLSKAEQLMTGGDPCDLILSSKLNCSHGLVHLENRRYKQAAISFLRCHIDISGKFNDIVNAEDIALYGGLCAISTFSREELKDLVVGNQSFHPFLELVPQLRDFINDFYSSRYRCCMEFLESFKSELLNDIYIHHHLTELYSMIRSRSIIQFFSPYLSVDINVMANAFNTPCDILEHELSDLIMEQKIAARIDSQKKVLHARSDDQRSMTFHKALQVGQKYLSDTKALLLRLNLIKQDFVINSSKSRLEHLI